MKQVIVDYSKRTAEKVVVVSNSSINKLTGNATFPDLPVALADQAMQTTTVDNAITAAALRDREKLAALRSEKKILADMLRKNAKYVNAIVIDGDEEKLLSSGFDLTKTPEQNQLPSAIEKFDADFTNIIGSIQLGWKRSRHARYYNVFISADHGQTWTMLNTVFGRKMLVEQLVSGKRYQFKVVPVGLAGDGPESDIASQVAA